MMAPFCRCLLIALLAAFFRADRSESGEKDKPPPKPAKQAEARLEVKSGTLHGVIDLPKGDGPFPVMVLLAGSGPTDRDGNQPKLKNDCLKALGQGLAEKGIAVLRYDRRGIGKSAAAQPKEDDFRFEMLAEDAAAWVKQLRKDARFTKVGIMGHSEGSLVGILAAKEAKVDAFVALAGAGRAAPIILREQLTKNLSKDWKEKSDKIIDELVAGRTVAEVPKELASLFRPSVQPYIISMFKYDPAKELSKLEVPVLVVQGTTDFQITVEDAKRLAAACKDAKLCIIEGMNHVLKSAKAPLEQVVSYSDPKMPLAPELVDEIAGFLKKTIGGK